MPTKPARFRKRTGRFFCYCKSLGIRKKSAQFQNQNTNQMSTNNIVTDFGLNLNAYSSPATTNVVSDKRFNKNEFTPSEDDIILEQIRRNPLKRGSHKFYDQLAINYLPRHTGNTPSASGSSVPV